METMERMTKCEQASDEMGGHMKRVAGFNWYNIAQGRLNWKSYNEAYIQQGGKRIKSIS